MKHFNDMKRRLDQKQTLQYSNSDKLFSYWQQGNKIYFVEQNKTRGRYETNIMLEATMRQSRG